MPNKPHRKFCKITVKNFNFFKYENNLHSDFGFASGRDCVLDRALIEFRQYM